MEPLASLQDVEANYRSLRGQEVTNAETWLRTASGELRNKVPGIDARITLDSSLADLVRGIVAMAVVRVLRGADRTDPSTVADIFFTRAELTSVTGGNGTGSRTGVGSIRLGTWAAP